LIESGRKLIKESMLQLKGMHLLFQFVLFKVQKHALVTQATRGTDQVKLSPLQEN
jgi:hypothetical protein